MSLSSIYRVIRANYRVIDRRVGLVGTSSPTEDECATGNDFWGCGLVRS
ncbi:hypothetical protein JI435_404110 [Parastagonospora nodorum SN15]|uniref:Uncharacterized protein n=1 Tax=Phaeosphaeria nodorum (strain SN15 / ATCC MYA-4574 / FGSC 10173) TaxID=321614 RepID=A0A7U2HYQ0_PHANO|nr:hypothetical protein JI435_404110 [Parastagonospora nodorum SN15]